MEERESCRTRYYSDLYKDSRAFFSDLSEDNRKRPIFAGCPQQTAIVCLVTIKSVMDLAAPPFYTMTPDLFSPRVQTLTHFGYVSGHLDRYPAY